MPTTKRPIVGVAIAATTALTLLGTTPAQAGPGKDGEHSPTAAAKVDERLAPDRVAGPRSSPRPPPKRRWR